MIDHKILWLVTARSGSKGVPNKNIKKIGDYSLIEHKIRSVKNLDLNQEIWLSTDSKKYADIGKKCGAKIPFIRSKELSRDKSSSIDVVLDAISFADSKGYLFSHIGLLEPTSPFVTPDSMFKAYNKLINQKSAFGIVAVKELIPHRIFLQDDSMYLKKLSQNLNKIKLQNRQVFPTQITPSGGFYIYDWNNFKKVKTFYTEKTLAYKLHGIESLEIDHPEDLIYAEFLYKNK